MSIHEINNVGGVLQYWESIAATRPNLARMALDFLTAPGECSAVLLSQSQLLTSLSASSVDAERAFSGGRLQVNHLQHGTNSQTFRAQMAVGSWVGSDIFPTLEPFEKIIERGSSRSQKGKAKAVVQDSKGKVKAKAKEVARESDDDTEFEWKGENAYD